MYTLRADPTAANGNPNANNAVNTRQIAYISPRVLGTAPVRSGIASDNGQFYDPWGTPYGSRSMAITTITLTQTRMASGAGPSHC